MTNEHDLMWGLSKNKIKQALSVEQSKGYPISENKRIKRYKEKWSAFGGMRFKQSYFLDCSKFF